MRYHFDKPDNEEKCKILERICTEVQYLPLLLVEMCQILSLIQNFLEHTIRIKLFLLEACLIYQWTLMSSCWLVCLSVCSILSEQRLYKVETFRFILNQMALMKFVDPTRFLFGSTSMVVHITYFLNPDLHWEYRVCSSFPGFPSHSSPFSF